jgi:hypothetical protein
MKTTLRVLALLLVLVTVGKESRALANGTCGYHCGTVLYTKYVGANCCDSTYTCPNGQQVPAWAGYDSGSNKWWICPVPR